MILAVTLGPSSLRMVSEMVPGLVARVDVYEALNDKTQTDETDRV